mmetsp:Transcript_15452/g.38033  ORF Transcript_15452/g.38033 Transcript_15452/m.38033 type:complete len:130 (-) Transcript_15452:129-518(-)
MPTSEIPPRDPDIVEWERNYDRAEQMIERNGGGEFKKFMRQHMRNISIELGNAPPDEETASCDSEEFRRQLKRRKYKHEALIVDVGRDGVLDKKGRDGVLDKKRRKGIKKANEKALAMQADHDSGDGFD